MVIFIDTSAVVALLNAADPNHAAASDALRRHLDSARLITHNYVVLEAAALLQRRFGVGVVRAFVERLLPRISVVWVDAARHDRAMTSLLSRGRRRASLVDRVSFDVMREMGVQTAFAYDADFRREGFALLD